MRFNVVTTAAVAALVLGGALTAIGCTPTSSSTPQGASDGGVSSSNDGSANAASALLTCSGIFECVEKCAEGDDPCADACFNKGSTEGQSGAEGIVKCSTDNKCEDTTCFQTNCQAELATCLKPSGSGQPLTGDAPAGSVTPDLVGKWYNFGELWEFGADGTASHFTEVKGGSCPSEELEKGTAVVSGTDLTIYFTSGLAKYCGSPGDPYKPNTKGYIFRIEQASVGPILKLQEKECRYSDPAQAEFYCRQGFDKKE